ncbi:MAG: TVP38/TMEM64 family protein [Pseudomonadota bacterium]
MKQDEASGQPARARLIFAACMLLTLIGAGIAGALVLSEAGPTEIEALLVANRDWAGALIILLMILHCFVPFPAELPALAAGALFGVVQGVALIWIGAMIGAALSFWLARRLGQPFVMAMLPARHRARLDAVRADQAAITLLIGRLLPVIAFNLINYAAGLTPVRWSTFLWTTAIGILPLTILVVAMGAQLRALSLETMAVVSLLCIALVMLGWWAWRRINRQAR